jgi:hypothetical protein
MRRNLAVFGKLNLHLRYVILPGPSPSRQNTPPASYGLPKRLPRRVTLQQTGTLPKLELVSSHYCEFIKRRPRLKRTRPTRGGTKHVANCDYMWTHSECVTVMNRRFRSRTGSPNRDSGPSTVCITAFPFIWNPAVKGCRLNRRGLDRFRMADLMTNSEICLPRDLIAHLDDAVRVLLG